jgi:predicted porin
VRANVQEKYQVYVGIGYELTEKSKIAVRYGYEKIRNYNNVADDDRNNHFIGTEFQVGF